jgi:CTP synthase
MHDVSNIWQVPLMLQSQGAHATICKQLGLGAAAARLDTHAWKTNIADR